MTNPGPVAEVRQTGPAGGALASAALLRDTAPWVATLSVLLATCLGLAEGSNLLLLVPLLSAVGLDFGEHLRWLTVACHDLLTRIGATPTLGGVLLLWCAVATAQALLLRLQTKTATALRERVATSLRLELFRSAARGPWSWFLRTRQARLLNAITHDVERAAEASAQVLHLATHAAIAGAQLALAVLVSPASVGVILSASGLLLLILAPARRRLYRLGATVGRSTEALHATAADLTRGARTIRAHGLGQRALERLEQISQTLQTDRERLGTAGANARLRFDLYTALTVAVVVYVAVEYARLEAPTLVLLLFLFARLARRATVLHGTWGDLLRQAQALERVQALSLHAPASTPLEGSPLPLDECVALEGVSFTYPEGGFSLREVSLRLPAGSITALVGPSGAGKTTIADLVSGLLQPQAGCLRVDGLELTPAIRPRWQQSLAYVAQEPFLFAASLRENMHWAAPQSSEEDMLQALDSVGASALVRGLARGLDTVIGDEGRPLSGGERQRLALACAMLRKPRLLVLDEATTGLDGASVDLIAGLIRSLRGRVTVLLLGHDPWQVEVADAVYRVEEGGVMPVRPPALPDEVQAATSTGSR